MMQFDKPTVGNKVWVRQEHVSHLYDGTLTRPIFSEGIVLKSELHDPAESFRLKGKYGVERIMLKFVTDLKNANGSPVTKSEKVSGKITIQRWKVAASKGGSYIVAYNGTAWACQCVGYKYRGSCKHIEKVMKKV